MDTRTPEYHNQFFTHLDYWGKIAENHDTIVYGYETLSHTRDFGRAINIPAIGGCFGYVQRGGITLNQNGTKMPVNAGSWFTSSNGASFTVGDRARVAVFQRKAYEGYHGPYCAIGYVESFGRLKYINGCHDSLLASPIKKGDPCFSALYMPTGINQTLHTHPSTRCGVIDLGEAVCETPEAQHQLAPGMIFFLPRDGWHKFRTDLKDTTMRLLAYHPDSDFGATDEDHPMLNRTLVDGVSAKDMPEVRTK